MPYTPANILRALAERHPEQAEELRQHATTLDAVGRVPLNKAFMRELNGAWARGNYWCDTFKGDDNPLVLR